MSERIFNQFKGSIEKGVISLYVNATIGSSGAVTLTLTSGGSSTNKGIYSVVRNSEGIYTIKFGDINNLAVDNYYRLLGINFTYLNSTLTAVAPQMQVLADNSTTGSIQVQFYSSLTGTPAIAELESGSEMILEIMLKHGAI